MIPAIAIGIWWTSNTIAHIAIHAPPFVSPVLNRSFSLFLTALLGIPQTLWRERHLAHHAGREWRLSLTPRLGAELVLVGVVWAILASARPDFFLAVYVPGYLAGLGLCAVQGHYEHARGTTSHYGRIYNLLCFNDGYHAEHHARPGLHWSRLADRIDRGARTSRWPPLLRWLDGLIPEATRVEQEIRRSHFSGSDLLGSCSVSGSCSGFRFPFRSRTLKRARYESSDLRVERRLQPPREQRTPNPEPHTRTAKLNTNRAPRREKGERQISCSIQVTPRVGLEMLERLVLCSPRLQRFVLESHRRALARLVSRLPRIDRVAIVGGGLFPRTALILRDLLPGARLVVIDADEDNLETARSLIGGAAEFVHRRYRAPEEAPGFDLVVIPLSLDEGRGAIYAHPPAKAVLVHDWLWRARGESAIVSPLLLKRLNLVRT
jgi:hypothetical protein